MGAFFNVTLPIGGRIALPSSINTAISVVKNTSLMYVIGYPELTTTALNISNLQFYQGGQYKVEVRGHSNSMSAGGTNISALAMLTVLPSPVRPELRTGPGYGGLDAQGFHFTLLGPTGVVYRLQTSSNLSNWAALALVQEIRANHPFIPVILMTAFGSEEIAIQALQRGAASYVPKGNLVRDLAETIENVLAVAKVDQNQQRLLECLTHSESQFLLDNDPSLIPPLIGYLQNNLARMRLCDDGT